MRAIGRFQSTLPRGSDGYYFSHRRNFGEISIHAPSRERLTIILACTKHINISIHAPSRERHVQEFFDLYTDAISIHAPSRERHKTPLCSSLRLLFQSTLPRGSDTIIIYNQKNMELQFQSTLPRGSDGTSDIIIYKLRFISIHAPSRERPLIAIIIYNQKNDFNPRSLAGATHVALKLISSVIISIHAPSRERLFQNF